jgi:hypothetical protein
MRREAAHSRVPGSARGVEVILRVLIFDKLGLHVLDRRTLLRRLRKEDSGALLDPGRSLSLERAMRAWR